MCVCACVSAGSKPARPSRVELRAIQAAPSLLSSGEPCLHSQHTLCRYASPLPQASLSRCVIGSLSRLVPPMPPSQSRRASRGARPACPTSRASPVDPIHCPCLPNAKPRRPPACLPLPRIIPPQHPPAAAAAVGCPPDGVDGCGHVTCPRPSPSPSPCLGIHASTPRSCTRNGTERNETIQGII